MAYPLVQHPTWKELINQLDVHGVSFKKTACELSSPLDGSDHVAYFEREGVGRYVVVVEDQDERVMPSVIRSVCAGLQLDPADFGFELG